MGLFVPGPAPSGNPIVHIVEQHAFQTLGGILASVQYQAEAPVDELAPSHAPSAVDGYPTGSPEAVPDHIVDGHVRGEFAAVIYVAGLPIGGIGPAHLVVVPAQDHRRT